MDGLSGRSFLDDFLEPISMDFGWSNGMGPGGSVESAGASLDPYPPPFGRSLSLLSPPRSQASRQSHFDAYSASTQPKRPPAPPIATQLPVQDEGRPAAAPLPPSSSEQLYKRLEDEYSIGKLRSQLSSVLDRLAGVEDGSRQASKQAAAARHEAKEALELSSDVKRALDGIRGASSDMERRVAASEGIVSELRDSVASLASLTRGFNESLHVRTVLLASSPTCFFQAVMLFPAMYVTVSLCLRSH